MLAQELCPCRRAAIVDAAQSELEIRIFKVVGKAGLNIEDMAFPGVEPKIAAERPEGRPAERKFQGGAAVAILFAAKRRLGLAEIDERVVPIRIGDRKRKPEGKPRLRIGEARSRHGQARKVEIVEMPGLLFDEDGAFDRTAALELDPDGERLRRAIIGKANFSC